jgi:hypothetical protein
MKLLLPSSVSKSETLEQTASRVIQFYMPHIFHTFYTSLDLDLEDRAGMFFRNIGKLALDYKVSHQGRQ